ncbi:MAG: helix-turn-helix domain-containing protein [Thiohalomonadaceae bacterium]
MAKLESESGFGDARRGFAARFREALAELGLTPKEQARLSRLFGVSGQAVRKWAEGTAMPSSTRMPEVARVLGVRRAWLQDGEAPMRHGAGMVDDDDPCVCLSADEHRLITHMRLLDPPVREAAMLLINRLAGGENKE